MKDMERDLIRNGLRHNSHELYALSLDEFDHVVATITKSSEYSSQRSTWAMLRGGVEAGANYSATSKDLGMLTKLFADLGFSGTKAYIKYYKGQPYVIFKGNPRLRTIFTGTRYGLQNAKVVQMGVGKSGAIAAVRSGGILTVVLVSAFRIADYILTDQVTLNQLIGALATDIIKIGIATGASIITAAGAAAIFTVAVGPIVAAIGVGLLVSYGLSRLDNRFEITEKVISALDELQRKKNAKVEDFKKSISRTASEFVDSALDYVIDETRRALINTAKHYLHRNIPQW
ncbi:hypothetical protein [Microbulbifer agarilyticus]|uniref:hypothetical protein n=1 Tax=Microbulbifer agarilyticus TaxID=260552 RepID=UPI001CD51587|nr:hypothetical protein [Microbulbifer agarilyticus]MCA0893438.1 hypothetical protein [Microbulbifer agarilyticus]